MEKNFWTIIWQRLSQDYPLWVVIGVVVLWEMRGRIGDAVMAIFSFIPAMAAAKRARDERRAAWTQMLYANGKRSQDRFIGQLERLVALYERQVNEFTKRDEERWQLLLSVVEKATKTNDLVCHAIDRSSAVIAENNELLRRLSERL